MEGQRCWEFSLLSSSRAYRASADVCLHATMHGCMLSFTCTQTVTQQTEVPQCLKLAFHSTEEFQGSFLNILWHSSILSFLVVPNLSDQSWGLCEAVDTLGLTWEYLTKEITLRKQWLNINARIIVLHEDINIIKVIRFFMRVNKKNLESPSHHFLLHFLEETI